MFNLLLKINTKIGGKNSLVSLDSPHVPMILKNGTTMIVGVDITHPSDKDNLRTSISAAVATVDHQLSRFVTAVCATKSTDTMVREINFLFKDLLSQYRDYNKSLPEHIIIYRDGVSEGQFGDLMNLELANLREVFKFFEISPKLTFIVVQKRHHTRVVPANSRDGVGRAQNVPPGTVIDTDIVHPKDFDFYLIAHEGIQGTSRPNHYYCLFDENNFSADDLQLTTFLLSHNFNRCCNAISTPSVVAYAHLAAYRARLHYEAQKETSSLDKLSRVPLDQGDRIYYC